MSYTFRNTEINNEKASVFETKSLLYLIGKSGSKKEIEYITFDCFNDVSGIDKSGTNIWDIQSKNEAKLNPKKIGKYLFTLFDNSISKLSFKEFIFFTQKLDENYKTDINLNIYNCSNFTTQTLSRIKNGLIEEVDRVLGDATIHTVDIEKFLNNVIIVEDDTTEQEYLKLIIKFKNKSLKNDDFYLTAFKELRDIQSSKKNSYIENETIANILDVIKYNRHLKILDIDTFILCRILGFELFTYKGIPVYFSVYTDHLPIDDRKDLVQDCNSNLSRCLFNKNSNKEFWSICERIISHLENNIQKDVEKIFQSIFNGYVIKFSYLDQTTIKYLIALIMEGL